MQNRGYLLTEKGNFRLVETRLPDEPPEHSVLLRIEYCGICGGDHSCYLGRRPEYPKSLGHEFVGMVLSVGKKVHRFQAGDFVVSDLNYRCGKCDYCTDGKSHLCTDNNAEKFSNRGFFQYMVIDETYLYKVELPAQFLFRAALIEPLSCVIYACNQFERLAWKRILVNGCGSIGTLFCFYLTRTLKECDISVYDADSRRSSAAASCFGVKCIRSIPEESFDGVCECTNSPIGVQKSLQGVKRGGAACILSHLYGEPTSFIYETICKKELQAIFPLRNGSPINMNTAIECITKHWTVDFDRLIGIYGFDALPDVFREKGQVPFNKQVIRVSET